MAPDFTLTDYYGTTHHLYSYLNAGKTVYLEDLRRALPHLLGLPPERTGSEPLRAVRSPTAPTG